MLITPSKLFAHSRFEFKAMGTKCSILLYANNAEIAAKAIAAAATEINRLEEKYSRYKVGNFFHRLNQAAKNGRSFQIDDECASLFHFADTCYQQSGGLFDISSGILRRAWNFEKPQLPDPALLKQILKSVGWHHVSVKNNVVSFARKGMELDFGGVVKEYAADCAASVCRQHGIKHGIVDLSGDIVIIGPSPDGLPWNVGIQHPRYPDKKIATFELFSGAIATSGDYARCIEIEGKRYSHLLSPKNGWPVSHMSSVTVVAPQCILAGAATTTSMLMEKNGVAWLEELGLPHVWADLDGNVGGSKSGSSKITLPE